MIRTDDWKVISIYSALIKIVIFIVHVVFTIVKIVVSIVSSAIHLIIRLLTVAPPFAVFPIPLLLFRVIVSFWILLTLRLFLLLLQVTQRCLNVNS